MLIVYCLVSTAAVMATSSDVIQQRSEELNSLRDKTKQLENLVLHQASEIADQNTLNRQLFEQLARLSSVVAQQEDKLFRLLDQGQNLDGRSIHEISSRSDDAPLDEVVDQFSQQVSQMGARIQGLESDNSQEEELSTLFNLRQNLHGRAVHEISSRSNDAPLEEVVDQLSQQISQMGARIQALESDNTQQAAHLQALQSSQQQQVHAIQDAGSSAFVRWGSASCPPNSHLVYSGVVGGSFWSHKGAAVNYLCLTMSPVTDNSFGGGGALLFGGGYETGGASQERDPVCAVCRSDYPTTVMIPGTNHCTLGWSPLYTGYIMAGHWNYEAASEFVCVDSALESRPGEAKNGFGVLFYPTRTRCGTLPCGPYANDTVVTCVVCGQ